MPAPADHRVLISADSLPDWLAGRWAIERDIDHGRGAFTGTATFTAEPGGAVRWSEQGRIALDGHTGEASRVLTLHPDGESWDVRFDDGKPFHPLDLSSGHDEVEHLCGPDVYRGTFDPVSDDELVVRWHVTGPGRDDTILSRYRRLR